MEHESVARFTDINKLSISNQSKNSEDETHKNHSKVRNPMKSKAAKLKELKKERENAPSIIRPYLILEPRRGNLRSL